MGAVNAVTPVAGAQNQDHGIVKWNDLDLGTVKSGPDPVIVSAPAPVTRRGVSALDLALVSVGAVSGRTVGVMRWTWRRNRRIQDTINRSATLTSRRWTWSRRRRIRRRCRKDEFKVQGIVLWQCWDSLRFIEITSKLIWKYKCFLFFVNLNLSKL